MAYLLIALKLFATSLLIIIAIYSWVYFSQVKKIETQFELRLPSAVKRVIGTLAMLPMLVSLVVIYLVFSQIGF